MSCCINRNLFTGFMLCGIPTYRNYDLDKKVESASACLADNERWKVKLITNLMYAQEALRHTEEALPEEAVNYSDDQVVTDESIGKILSQREEVKQIVEEEVQVHDLLDKIYEIIATVAKKYKIGSCGEQASVTYTFLKNEKNLRKVELLTLVNGDHAFVVIGRDPLSDINDPMTWGKAAVVCEPWGKRYFQAKHLFDQLNKISQRTLYTSNVQSIGWMETGDVPPDVLIYRRIRLNQKGDKHYAKKALVNFSEGEEIIDKKITTCLIDYLDRKSKSKKPPILSEYDKKLVEIAYATALE